MSSHENVAKYALYGLAAVGLLSSLRHLRNLARWTYYAVRPRVPLEKTYGKGSWALVTGGASGIGLEFARQLGQKGFNVLIMGRNAGENERAVKFLSGAVEKGCRIVSLTEDISKASELDRKLLDYDVSILVNNAGVA